MGCLRLLFVGNLQAEVLLLSSSFEGLVRFSGSLKRSVDAGLSVMAVTPIESLHFVCLFTLIFLCTRLARTSMEIAERCCNPIRSVCLQCVLS